MTKYRFKRGIVFEVRRLARRESILTPNGRKNAFPGSYEVKDDYGQSWVVPATEVTHFLEKVPDG